MKCGFVGVGGVLSGGVSGRCAIREQRGGLRVAPGRASVRMTAVQPESATKINISGTNIDLTDSLRAYVQEKVGRAISKFLQFVTKVDVHLSVAHNPSIKHPQAAEVVVFAKGTVMRAEVKAENMYSSLDLVSDKITRKLRKYKEIKESKKAEKTSDVALKLAEEEVPTEEPAQEGAEEYPNKTDVVKIKEFPMPPQTVEDAALCLEYIDHDFYAFRDAETREIHVLYKRNHGGLGLIKPQGPE